MRTFISNFFIKHNKGIFIYILVCCFVYLASHLTIFLFIRLHLKARSLALTVGFLSYAKQEDILWLCSQKNVKCLIISILHLKPTHFGGGTPHFLYPPSPLQKQLPPLQNQASLCFTQTRFRFLVSQPMFAVASSTAKLSQLVFYPNWV